MFDIRAPQLNSTQTLSKVKSLKARKIFKLVKRNLKKHKLKEGLGTNRELLPKASFHLKLIGVGLIGSFD